MAYLLSSFEYFVAIDYESGRKIEPLRELNIPKPDEEFYYPFRAVLDLSIILAEPVKDLYVKLHPEIKLDFVFLQLARALVLLWYCSPSFVFNCPEVVAF